METLENTAGSLNNKSLFNKIFTFNEDMKYELFNLTQYVLIGFIPIFLLVKLMNKYTPQVDINKSSIEILIEIVLQLLFLYYGFFIIKHVISNIPTFSEKNYNEGNNLHLVIPILFGFIIYKTNISEKMDILFERFNELWNGKDESKNKKKKQNTSVKVSQPISSMLSSPSTMEQNNPYNLGNSSTTLISDLPTNSINSQPQRQQYPDYNSMFQNDLTKLVGANTPQMENFEIQPANSLLGNNFGSSF